MKIIRSLLIFLLIIGLLIAAHFAGHSTGFFFFSKEQQGAEENPNELTLTIWVSYKGPELVKFKELADKFCKDYESKYQKKIKIKADQVPFDDLVTNVRSAALSKKLPDIARIDVQKVTELAYHKTLVRLDTLEQLRDEFKEELAKEPNFDIIQAKRKQYMPGPFDINVVTTRNLQDEWETHLYGLPEQSSCLGLFWNRKLFMQSAEELQAAGLDPNRAPRTWDELVAYSKVLTKKVEGSGQMQYGFGMRNSAWWTFPYFNLYGVQFVKTDPKTNRKICTLGDELSCAALQLKVDLYQKHQIEAGAWKSGATSDEMGFGEEKYAMVLMGPWKIQEFTDKGLDFGVALVPTISEEEAKRFNIPVPVSATNVGGNSMVIFETSKNKALAYDFLNFMASCDTQVDWCQSLQQLPVNQEAANILLSGVDPKHPGVTIQIPDKLRVFMEQVKYSQVAVQLPKYEYIESTAMNPEMELALSGTKDVKSALLAAAQKIQDNILVEVNEEK